MACVIMKLMGNKDNYPRLVGGTFVTILEQYRKHVRPSRKHITKEEFVIGFFKAIGIPSSKCEGIGSVQASYFTRCDSWTFKDEFLDPFKLARMESSVSSLWKGVDAFFDEFMDDDKDAKMNVVSALKEMIELDDAINDTSEFVLEEKKKTITKSAVAEMSSVSFVPFITGVALYALRQNNKLGKDTIDKWCNYKRKVPAKTDIGRKYRGLIKDIPYEIKSPCSSL